MKQVVDLNHVNIDERKAKAKSFVLVTPEREFTLTATCQFALLRSDYVECVLR